VERAVVPLKNLRELRLNGTKVGFECLRKGPFDFRQVSLKGLEEIALQRKVPPRQLTKLQLIDAIGCPSIQALSSSETLSLLWKLSSLKLRIDD
jgi:hypothetical protein